MLTYAEVQNHSSKDDCWVIIHDKVYDVTSFMAEHPGGSGVILKYAGKDATKAFDPIHPGDTLTKYLPKECHLGPVDVNLKPKKAKKNLAEKAPVQKSGSAGVSGPVVDEFDVEYDEQDGKQPIAASTASVGSAGAKEDDEYDYDDEEISAEEKEIAENKKNMPDLSHIYNLHDFEYVAKKTMEKTAWAYYSSGSDDEIALRNNHLAYQRVYFNPKVLIDVRDIDFSTTMLGTKTSAPFYITATALGKLGHPEGETVLTKASARQDVIQMIPTLASCSFDEIMDSADGKQTQWFQLYVNSDRKITKSIVQHAEKRGVKAFFLTVDAPQLGRREKDMRSKHIEDISHVQGDGAGVARDQGVARAISSFIDAGFQWSDLEWFRSITSKPLVLKGVQSIGDALKAIEYGMDGIVLSNHGGRQLDSVKAPIEILAGLNPILKERGLLGKIEIYIDGGVRRASDVLKAIALGATGVGIGRPFLYAMSTYGLEGVIKAIQILKDEMVMNMRLLGAPTIADLNDTFIDTSGLGQSNIDDRLFTSVYEPLASPPFKSKL